MASNSITCVDEKDFDINFNSNPIVSGEYWVVLNDPLDLDSTNRTCVEATSNIDNPGSGWSATTEYPSCYDCVSNNNGVIVFQGCFGKASLPLVINVSGLTEQEYNQFVNDYNSGFTGSYYIEYIDNSILKKDCFYIDKKNELSIGTLSGKYYDQISEFLQAQGSQIVNELNYSAITSCEVCFKNIAVIYQVLNCVTENIEFVYLPQGFPQNYLISYTDGINEFCGVVQGQSDLTTTTFTYVTNYGPFNGEEGCTKCLTNQNQRVRIENCSDNTDTYVVWASQLFDLGNATNFELRGRDGGCFTIVGETTDPVDTSGFLDYEPHSGCTSCQTCNGVTYEYLDCDTLEVLGYFNTNQILTPSDSFLLPWDDTVYQVGDSVINLPNYYLPSVLLADCFTSPTYNVWIAKECLTNAPYYVLTDDIVTDGDVVKILYGENDFLCVTLVGITDPSNTNLIYNSKRDGSSNTITYNDCTDCTDNSTFGVRTLDCDNQDLTIFDLNYTAYTQFFTIPTSDVALEARKPFPGPIRNPFSNTCFVDGNGDCRTVIELCPLPPTGNLITPSSTYFSCPDCRTFNPPDTNSEDCINGALRAVNYNSLPLIPGDACSVDVGLQYNICTTITDVNITGSTNLAITEYTNCYQCLADNQGVVEVRECFGRGGTFTVTIDGLGFLPEFGTSAYMTIEVLGIKPITACFTFGSIRQLTTGAYNQGILDGNILIPQPTPIQELNCNTCLQNNLFTYAVARCTDDIVDYLNLPFGLNGSLISYSDGVNQFCGRVIGLGGSPGPYNFISNFGTEGICEDCLDVANDKILIQSCTNSDDTEIVWASALFQNGDVSNLSTQDGCFEVIGLTEDPVTLPYFLNFDPQPGCESCIECNGINYEYTTCNTFNGFDTATSHLIQTPGANISCSEYSYGSNKIYLGYVANSQIDVFDPVTNTIFASIPGTLNHRTNDIEYFDSTTLYTLSTDSSYGPTLGNVNKIDSTTDTLTNVYGTQSYNYYMTTDVTNNRLFFTSYNTVSGFYQVNSFNTLSNTVTDTLTSSSGYYRIKYAPNVNKVYTLSGYYDVKVLNANDLSVITTLTFSNYLRDIEYNPCTEQIYVTTASNYYSPSGNGEIKVIDTISDTVINTVSSYYRQNLIKYNPTDNKMYVTSSSYYSPNTLISVFNPQTNILNGTYSVYPTIYNTQDFTFYPTDNELYLPFYSSFNGSSDYLVELPMTYSSYSGYFKSYQYIPNGDIFYNPYNGECCEVIGTSSNYNEILYSVQTYNDCPSCNTCHGQVWVATGCGLSGELTFNVTANNGAQVGDIVRIMWGSNGWICVELQSLYVPTVVALGPSPTFYDSERDGLGNTIIYSDCTLCESSSDIGVTLVSCENGIEKYVSISVENYMSLNSLEGVTNFVINDSTGCYYVTNFCPIPLSATTEFTPVQFFAYCEFCTPEPDQPRSANTETFICIPDCEFTGSTAVSPPHPVWTDGYGTPVTQLNMVVLGGPNGLNA